MTNFKYQKELLMLLNESRIRSTDVEKYTLALNEIKIALIEKQGNCHKVRTKLQSIFHSRS